MRQEEIKGKWKLRKAGQEEWLDARVPGSVLETFLEQGRIPHPYYRDNEYQVREEFRDDYEYEGTFQVSEEILMEDHVSLVFPCVDTLGEIWLNGVFLGKTNNMHRTWEFPVKDTLRCGENQLLICLRSPVEYVENYRPKEGREISMINTGTMYGSQYLRKPHSMFGWDWGPQLPDLGILKPVLVKAWSMAVVTDVEILQDHREKEVVLSVSVTVLQEKTEDYLLTVQLTDPQGQVICQEKIPEQARTDFQIRVKNPRLWWPAGYGEQPLYEVKVLLKASGRNIQEKTYPIGLRTLTVSQNKDPWGKEFAFQINGIKIFAKGANYIPEDSVYPWITLERQEQLLEDALFANFNCIRIWGGGYYPSEEFYLLCDKKGLLVWQDLMYACNIYDLTLDFQENILKETEEVVSRLRHHACLALWCGNNEMESAWIAWEQVKDHPLPLKRDYLLQFEYLLPKAVRRADARTFYWPSSPSSGGSFDDPDSEDRGDTHYWSVWHGRKPFVDYQNHYFRFCSEFGFQSFPSMKTIESFTEKEDRNIFSKVMESHQKNPEANGKILNYLSETFRYPKNLEGLVYVSQIMQGIAIKTGVDHWRRNRGRCMGSIYWQFNDNWPVASWSSVDYYGRYKALHYMAAKFYAPLAGSICRKDRVFQVWAANETMASCRAQAVLQIKTMDFTVLRETVFQAYIPALSAWKLGEADFSQEAAGRQEEVFAQCTFTFEQEGKVSRMVETELFVPYKYLRLKDPKLQVHVEHTRGQYEFHITGQAFAPFVNLDFAHYDARLSQNFESLTGKEGLQYTAQEEQVRPLGDWTGGLEEDFLVQTLYDTYE